MSSDEHTTLGVHCDFDAEAPVRFPAASAIRKIQHRLLQIKMTPRYDFVFYFRLTPRQQNYFVILS